MPDIKLLDKSVAELIAAGEVVERPASVIKELVENSIDAKANNITVEIQRGGITYIRITDNGCGIEHTQVPTAFLRHATSKISNGSDLDKIATLGFRGEALAAVSAVAKVEMLTCAEGNDFGTHYCIEGAEEKLYEESGCPKGTTIIIRDIFYNTPARMKFLKKDVSEANACAAVVDRIALSHPEISFKFIRDGKQTLVTSGDGNIKNCVYSVLGREFSGSLIEASGEASGISVSGLICKPVACKPTRNNQFTFLNGRLVRSGTVAAAVEQAYKNSAMIGKFPAFVLYINIPFDMVDVNVHPAKTEVRFSDERVIFNAVYGAVKNALAQGDTRPEVKLNTPTFNPFANVSSQQYRQQVIGEKETIAEQIYKSEPVKKEKDYGSLKFRNDKLPSFAEKYSYVAADGSKTKPMSLDEVLIEYEEPESAEKPEVKKEETAQNEFKQIDNMPIVAETVIEKQEQKIPDVKLIGEAFSTYIIVEMGESVFMIDKHAAHERLIYNDLRRHQKIEVQPLLTPVTVIPAREEYDAIICNTELLNENGFEIEDFGNGSVVVRAVPSYLTDEDIGSLINEIAQGLITVGVVQTQREDHLFHTVACKAAIKAGSKTSPEEMKALAQRVLSDNDVMYCPHGRPVAFEIKKRELEKQFGRIQ